MKSHGLVLNGFNGLVFRLVSFGLVESALRILIILRL